MVRGTNPFVDLVHLTLVDQSRTFESASRAALYTIVVGLGCIRTLTVTSTFTSTSTVEGLGVSQAMDAGRLAVETGATRAGVGTRLRTTSTLTISLCCTNKTATGTVACRIFVEDLHLTDGWVVFSTEVIATGSATIATYTTVIVVTDVAVLVLVDIGTVTGDKVVTTTPCGTIATGAILVGSVASALVFEVVGQREQEVCAVARITTIVPVGSSVATDQSLIGLTRIELRDHDRGSFAVTLAMERRDTVSITS